MIINCTPNDVEIYLTSDCYLEWGQLYLREDMDPQPVLTYPASKEPARVTFIQKTAGMADGTLIFRWVPREITGLPEPKQNTYYIVSKMVAQACPERGDLIFSGTMVRVRDNAGAIVGCVDFSRV